MIGLRKVFKLAELEHSRIDSNKKFVEMMCLQAGLEGIWTRLGIDNNLQENRGGQNIGNFSKLKGKMYQEKWSEISGKMRVVNRKAISCFR